MSKEERWLCGRMRSKMDGKKEEIWYRRGYTFEMKGHFYISKMIAKILIT